MYDLTFAEKLIVIILGTILGSLPFICLMNADKILTWFKNGGNDEH